MRVTTSTAITAASLFALSMAACGGSNDSTGTSTAAAPTTAAAATTAPGTAESAPSPSAMMAATFGAGCAAVPTDPAAPGSFPAMARVPVATAAAGIPLLKSLVAAVTRAGLGATLDNTPDLTVFAPTNTAFAKIPKATLDRVLADKKTLTSILTYHVVAGKITPQKLAGKHTTLEGKDLTVTGSGSDFKVNGNSSIICGNVQTANATVYIVDGVLMPKG